MRTPLFRKLSSRRRLREDVVVEVDVREDLEVGQEVHLGAALLGLADDLHRRDLDAVALLDHAVLRKPWLNSMKCTLPSRRTVRRSHLRQAVDAAHAHAVQAARDLVAVLVELAAGVQLGQRDLGGRALGLVLVVHLHAGRNAAAVVDHRDRVVGVDGDDDVVAVAGQRFVDRVVDHLEHQVVQAGAVGGVADVHARALAHRLQAFEDLDASLRRRRVAPAGVASIGRAVDSACRRLGVRRFGLLSSLINLLSSSLRCRRSRAIRGTGLPAADIACKRVGGHAQCQPGRRSDPHRHHDVLEAGVARAP